MLVWKMNSWTEHHLYVAGMAGVEAPGRFGQIALGLGSRPTKSEEHRVLCRTTTIAKNIE